MSKLRYNKGPVISALTREGYFHPDPATNSKQKFSLGLLIDLINSDSRWQYTPQVAYFLATVAHECKAPVVIPGKSGRQWVRTFEPVEEAGTVAYFDERYGPQTAVGKRLGNTQKGDGSRFHGRGYVQITGRTNYARMGVGLVGTVLSEEDVNGCPATVVLAYHQALKAHGAATNDLTIQPGTFVEFPILARIPKISYENAVSAMFTGAFTGKKITDYISGTKTDYVNARRVINGTDRASEIAVIARDMEQALRDAFIEYVELAPGIVVEKSPFEIEKVEYVKLPSREDVKTEDLVYVTSTKPLPEHIVIAQKTVQNELETVPPAQAGQDDLNANAGRPDDEPTRVKNAPPATPASQPATTSQGQGSSGWIKVSSWKSHINGALGWLTGAGAGLIGWLQNNPKLLFVAGALIALVIILYFVRQTILDREKMRIAADPKLNNVR